jgi:hypothetical protein
MRTRLIGTAAIAAALALCLGQAAASAAVVATHTSKFLAGYSLQGNGGDRFRDLRMTVTVPSETSAVAPQSVVDGLTQATSVNGGTENGIGFVFDASAAVCLPGQWTLEYAADISVGSPMPIPPGSLAPLLDGGSPVCLNAGQSWYIEVFYNTKSHFAHFLAGPSGSNSDTLADVPDGGYHNFYSGGFGIDTTDGTQAANLTLGPAGAFGNVSVTQYNGHRRLADTLNTGQWTGTVSGGAPSVANPVTLTPSALGSGFTVSAP